MANKKILLVEDDPTTSKSIEMMLSHANLNVYTTSLGEEGVENPPHLDHLRAGQSR